MTIGDELEDRLVDTLLEEIEGTGPTPDLERRTLAALEDNVLPGPGSRRRRSWGVAAVALLALSVVTAIAAWQSGNRDEGNNQALPVREEPPQDPELRPPEELIAELADDDKAAAAARDLLRSGSRAVPALANALSDERAHHSRIVEVLEAMERTAAPALLAIADLILEGPEDPDAVVPVWRAAATLAPFADPDDREAARRAMLVVAFVRDGPGIAAVANGPAAGGRRNAPGGAPARPPYSLRQLARLLHRIRVDTRAPATEWIEQLEAASPFERELAARLLGDSSGEAVVTALRGVLSTTHQVNVEVEWAMDGFSGTYAFVQQHDDAIRLAAARSLVQVAGRAPAGALGHAHLLGHGSLREQQDAAIAVGRGGVLPEDEGAVADAVIAALHSDDTVVLRESITAAGILGQSCADARARLKELTGHSDPQIAACAEAALRSLGR